jgi:hypothetical protein
MESIGNESGGFIIRRFRRTHLETSECPEVLRHFWSGHSQTHVSERYVKLRTKRDSRLEWAERIALGFESPGDNLGQLIEFRKVG